MDTKYEKSMKAENEIYKEIQKDLKVPEGTSTGWPQFDQALDWLCKETQCVLDFGCGSGTLLFLCANRGTKQHLGIDLAAEGIHCAERRSHMMKHGDYQFKLGSIEQLQLLEDNSMDAILLSNIMDNLYPNDKSFYNCR